MARSSTTTGLLLLLFWFLPYLNNLQAQSIPFETIAVSCPNGSDGAINIVGANSNHSFTWSTGETKTDISELVAGIYTVTITDNFGVTSIQCIPVSEPPPPLQELQVRDQSCFGLADGMVFLRFANGQQPYTYSVNGNPYPVISNVEDEWSPALLGQSSGTDRAHSVATDAFGNVYITGEFTGSITFGTTTLTSSGNEDVFIVKKNREGQIVWAKQGGGVDPDQGLSIDVDNCGNVVVTGKYFGAASFGATNLSSPGLNALFIVKMDTDGNLLWAKSSQGFSSIIGRGTAVDNSGHVLVCGSMTGSGQLGSFSLGTNGLSSDFFLTKLSPDGVFEWATGGGGTNGSDQALSVAADSWGNIYMTGNFFQSMTLGSNTVTAVGLSDIFLAKYHPTGIINWVKVAGSAQPNETGNKVIITPDDNILLSGTLSGSASFNNTSSTFYGGTDAFIARYSNNGTLLWVNQCGGGGIDEGTGLASDGRGNIFFTGFFQTTGNFGNSISLTASNQKDGFIAKLDSLGGFEWVRAIKGNQNQLPLDMAIDPGIRAYIAGSFQSQMIIPGLATYSAIGGEDAFLAQIDLDVARDTITGLPANAQGYSLLAVDAKGCSVVDSFYISQPTEIIPQLDVHNISCFGFSDGSIQASASGGTPGYQFLWTGNIASDSVSGLGPGNISLTITDSNACVKTVTTNVHEPQLLAPHFTNVSNISCNGADDGFAVVKANGGTGPFSFTWSNSQTVDSISNLSVATYVVTITDANGCTAKDSANVSEPQALVSTVDNLKNVNCHGGNDGLIVIDVVGGTQPYAYNWNTAYNYQDSAYQLNANLYLVTISDVNNCIHIDSFEVSQPPDLIMTLPSITHTLCNGDSSGAVIGNVTGGTTPYQISWSNNQFNTLNASDFWAGTHSLTVVDSNFCSDTLFFDINEPSPVVGTMTVDSISCFNGSDGKISVIGSGGTGPNYSFLWETGLTNPNRLNLEKGVYSISVFDQNGCMTVNSAEVFEPDLLQAALDDFHQISCHGLSDGSITVNGYGGTQPYIYEWTGGVSNSDSAGGLGVGIYNVTIYDGNQNCALVFSPGAIVEPDPLTGNIDYTKEPTCFGDDDGIVSLAVQGGNAPYSYDWPGTGLVLNMNTKYNLDAGTIEIFVQDSKNCGLLLEIVLEEPEPITLELHDIFHPLCHGETTGEASFDASGGTGQHHFEWPTGVYDTLHYQSGLAAGHYNITVTDDHGCQGFKEIEIRQPDHLDIMFEGINISCFGFSDGSITAQASGGYLDEDSDYKYIWNGGDKAELTDLKSGHYRVTVMDDHSCLQVASFKLEDPEPIEVDFSMDPMETPISQTTISFSNFSTGPFTEAHWDFGGFGNSDELNPTFEFPPDSGLFPVVMKLTNDQGCKRKETLYLHITGEFFLFVPQAFSPNGDLLNDVFKPEGHSLVSDDYRLQIFNRWGIKVFESNHPDKGWDGTYKGQPMPDGVYVWRMFTHDPYIGDSEAKEDTGTVTLIR